MAMDLPPTASDASAAQSQPRPIESARRGSHGWLAAGICAALLVMFSVLSYSAVLTKSATFDEPLHVVGAFMHRYFHDYRINPEDPALFGIWAALPQNSTAVFVDVTSPEYQLTTDDITNQWRFIFKTLYQTKDNDTDAFINTSRAMFVLLGVALGAVAAWWSWKLAGAAAAAITTFLFALDPNLLAHSALVKNDVPLSLLMLALSLSLWGLGRRGAGWQVAAVGLICSAAINVKFSGGLFAPMVVLLLAIRAAMPGTWRLMGLNLTTFTGRFVAVGVMCVGFAFLAWAITWGVYGFRFAATSDHNLLNTQKLLPIVREKELVASIAQRSDKPRDPTIDEFKGHKLGAIPQFVVWAEDHKLLPQAWLFGFLYTYATTLVRSTFLCGKLGIIGWWYYFPAAMLFKTPLATLTAMLGAAVLGLARFILPNLSLWKKGESRDAPALASDNAMAFDGARAKLWTLACLLLPPGLYMAAALLTSLNLGLRHVLPVYPFIFIGVSLATVLMLRLFRKSALVIGIVLAMGLAAESLLAWPNYLAFFNTASGGSGGGLRLLADSNLDWGQDLPALAEWRKKHMDRPMYFSYFGVADPAYYGIDYINGLGGVPFLPQRNVINGKFYLAVSATNLQGVYLQEDPRGRRPYQFLLKHKPIAVIGGTIYVYNWPKE